jgi:hypothetical protein
MPLLPALPLYCLVLPGTITQLPDSVWVISKDTVLGVCLHLLLPAPPDLPVLYCFVLPDVL